MYRKFLVMSCLPLCVWGMENQNAVPSEASAAGNTQEIAANVAPVAIEWQDPGLAAPNGIGNDVNVDDLWRQLREAASRRNLDEVIALIKRIDPEVLTEAVAANVAPVAIEGQDPGLAAPNGRGNDLNADDLLRELRNAASIGDLDEVRALIKRTGKKVLAEVVNNDSKSEDSIFQYIIANEGADIVKALIEALPEKDRVRVILRVPSVSPNRKLTKGTLLDVLDFTPYPSYNEGLVQFMIQQLIAGGVDIKDVVQNNGRRLLHFAVQHMCSDIIQNWIDKKPPALIDAIEARSNDGMTPLGLAVCCRYLDIAQNLIGAEPKEKRVRVIGDVLRHFIITMGFYVDRDPLSFLLKALTEAGGNVKDVAANDGRTLLHWAAYRGDAAIVEDLITAIRAQAGDQAVIEAVNAQAKDGRTPLHYAARYRGGFDTVKNLLDAGADVNATDEKGRTPLVFAREEYGSPAVIELLTNLQ